MEHLARFVGIWMVFVTYIAVGVEGAAAYNATCTGAGTGDCAIVNNICDAGTLKCACATNLFRKGGTECATKIALSKACTAGQPTDQCADSNAECNVTVLTCRCKSAHFENKDGVCDPKATLKSNCGVAETARNQCVADTECQDDAKGTKKCLCKATHYESSGACPPRKKPDEEGCAADQCVTHATCNTGSSPTKCQCDVGYTATPTASPTMCSGVVKVITLPYIYVIPILVSMMFLLR